MTQETENFSFGEYMGIPAITIKGPFDFMNSKIDLFVDDQIGKGNVTLMLNLSATHYLTAMGIAALFKIIKKLSAAGGLLHILGPTDDMIEMIKMGKMYQYVSYIVN